MTVSVTSVYEANRNKAKIARQTLRASAFAFLALAFFGVTALTVPLARADFLRRRPNASNIDEALKLDPLNAYGHTLHAELLAQAASDSSSAWNLASKLDPRNAEILIQLAIHAEQRGDLSAAEELLLRAARFNQTFLVRWSLVNYYARHQAGEKAMLWSKQALARGSGDLRSLFTQIESNGPSPAEFLRDALPPNRNLMLAYLRYRVSQPDGKLILEVSRKLCQLIRVQPAGWPGLDLDPFAKWIKRSFPATAEEELALIAALHRLIALGNGAQAIQLSNLLSSLSPDRPGPWNENQLVMNSNFRANPSQNPLDWRPTLSDSVSAKVWPAQGTATIHLNGSQPQSVDLLTQIIRIPPNRPYLFEAQTQSGSSILNPGFAWTLRDARSGKPLPFLSAVPHSTDWNHQRLFIPPSTEDRLWLLVLEYRRASGTVRREQEIHIRSVTIIPSTLHNQAGEIQP